uniref:Alpha-galactosidase n=1 Tax=Tetraselmis chuii TaxID=63592 RepID=A0A6U1HMQ3_9CHLO|mmetsp:Transcript_28753/g.51413  ORF Transcript_28753/g.51413 Transcript_28753/m.51413 type:complete len:505 (+) Transcript_28753:181-1695(+)|eukprot:CAMPEP_0177784984 /NCGR_PEP_ID=MMETSP0491_2-20121128/20034_1 /TAXON_ID=63592 /ORGANISM="Tetraselmis chuii, Strain PLY429" /LENGTH=504 /DNA_ID=CAMNT_0019305871 /DNA_START=502 /DNA_END=2016 /DNA_ORIENTATION=-
MQKGAVDEEARAPLLKEETRRDGFGDIKPNEGAQSRRRRPSSFSCWLGLAMLAIVVVTGGALALHCCQCRHRNRGTPAVEVESGLWAQARLGLSAKKPYSPLGLDNGLGLTPPMGWNSWNTLACNVDEESVRAAADLIVDLGLKDLGYTYVNVDDCWHGERLSNGSITHDAVKFPSGIKALADYVHSKGLKFGIYSDAGQKTCAGRPGSWGYEVIDAATYAEWGVDFLKYDNCFCDGDCPGVKEKYPVMREALNATGRPIFFSMCEWGVEDPATWARPIANSWRTTPDIAPLWTSVVNITKENNRWAPYAGPGGFNDPDMLEVGVPANVYGPGLTAEEERTHFVLWALMKSPLLIGADLRSISQHSLDLLMNKHIIAVNQDPLGVQGTLVSVGPDNPNAQVWAGPLSEGPALAVALHNSGDLSEATVSVNLARLGIPSGRVVRVIDLLDGGGHLGDFTGSYSASVAPHDVHFVRVEVVNDADVLPVKPLVNCGRFDSARRWLLV